ncbi:hypothetical protein GGS26DRAFT_569719 [Hypomontagnella submonticulosa]|nr:hypothetical protein GGS26DRAFT_569719 [Hypomontagnella submonticulosa]
MKRRLWRAALLVAALVPCAVPVQSQTTTITSPPPTRTGDPFQGFVIAKTTTQPLLCPDGSIFATSSTFAGCCASTSSPCALATGCKDNALVFADGEPSNCGPLQCHTRKIFATKGAKDPQFIEPVCAGVGEADTLYRVAPLTSQLVLPLTAVDSSSAAEATGVTMMLTIVGPGGSAAPMAAASTSGGNNPTPSQNIPLIIIAAIVGAMALMGLIAFAFYFGRRHGQASRDRDHESRGVPGWKIRAESRTSSRGGSGPDSRRNTIAPIELSTIRRPNR